MKGKLIVFEGTDASGKSAQIELLVNKLNKKKIKCVLVHHPNYKSPFGALVGQYLAGTFGQLGKLPTEIVFLLYSLDRYQFKQTYTDILKKGKFILADRYTESALGFQTALYHNLDKEPFLAWMREVDSRLPQSDMVVFLNMHPKIRAMLEEERSKKLKYSKDREYLGDLKKDIHEQSDKFQEQVRQTYIDLAKREPKRWLVVDCFKESNEGPQIKTVEEIHNEIWIQVQKRFDIE